MIYTHIAAALLGAAVAATSAWGIQGWRLGGQIAEARATYAAALAQSEADARAAQITIDTKYQEALNAARNREALLRTELDHLRRVSDGLRNQNADAARRLAAAPPAAVLEYATALGAVFEDCRAAYGGMVEKADGHAADVRTLTAAWPVVPAKAEAEAEESRGP